MNRIISITIGGRNIAIEETAHREISSYLESLRRYYAHEEGRDEIITDIEHRFAELMHEKIRKGANHITNADVGEMIATMGRPEDFDNEADASAHQNYNGPNFTPGEKRRLYRDENNKIIGGVCSGIANWLNIDPTVVRVLFAIISLGGLGTGFLVYLLLWILLPAKNMNVYRGKKMYRNPDDRVIGGVAGGMGAYFNINPATIRWILAIPLVLSVLNGIRLFNWNADFYLFPNLFFGSLTGTFIFIYIILWIVLPEADTPYQKMEMHGKTIDVNTIKENVQSAMSDLNSRMQHWGKEVKQSGERMGSQARHFTQQQKPAYTYASPKKSKGIGYVIAMIFKAFFVFIAGTIAISLFVAFLAFLFSGFVWAPVNNFLWTSDNQQMWAWGTLLFFIGAPIVGLLISLARMILSIRTPGNYLNWLFGGLWAVGWVCLTLFIASVSKDIKRSESIETPVTIAQPARDKMILTVTQPRLQYEGGRYEWIDVRGKMNGIGLTADTLKLSTIAILFEKSNDSLFHVSVIKEALGKTDEEARTRAANIQYQLVSQDSVLQLPNGFAIDKNSKFRFQNVTLKIQVPVGKKINIDASVREKLSDGQMAIRSYRNARQNGMWRTGTFLTYRANTDYTMDSNGKLRSAGEKEITASSTPADDYRWNNSADTATPAAGADNDYRFDTVPANEKSKEVLRKELEQKQKELDDLKKQLGQ